MLVGKGILSGFVLAAGSFAVLPFRPVVFYGHSMEPTYSNLSVGWATKNTSELHDGDIVVINTPIGRLVKRIAYLPGEKQLQLHTVEGWQDVEHGPGLPKDMARYRQITVPEGKVYLLGDNASISVDSRAYGYFDLKDVDLKLIDPRPASNHWVDDPNKAYVGQPAADKRAVGFPGFRRLPDRALYAKAARESMQ